MKPATLMGVVLASTLVVMAGFGSVGPLAQVSPPPTETVQSSGEGAGSSVEAPPPPSGGVTVPPVVEGLPAPPPEAGGVQSRAVPQLVRIQNHWKPYHYVHIESGPVVAGPIQPGWLSAQWTLEPVAPGSTQYWIRNVWKRDLLLNIESSALQASGVMPGWLSARWTLEPVAGSSSLKRIHNVWKPDQYLHIESGALQASAIQPGWLSAMWKLSFDSTVAAIPLPPPAPKVSTVYGVPPPIGPPNPVAPPSEFPIDYLITNLKDDTGNNIGVRGQVDTAIANANANAATQTSVRAKIRVESFTVYGPYMLGTTYTDRPNHRYVRIPYIVGYTVYDVKKNVGGAWVSTSVTRQISQSIGIQIFCDRWETGTGSLKLVTDIARPYLEPDSEGISESVVDFFLNGHLTDFIDSQVRQQIAKIPIRNGSTNLAFSCNALNASKGDIATPIDDQILYSYNPPNNPPKLQPPTINSELTLTLQSIKRLAARDLHGQPLYAASETPALEVFANQYVGGVQLPALQEGQQVPITSKPIVVSRAGLTSLSVLVNVRQANFTQIDSATQIYGESIKYGHGTQTMRVRKSYWTKANPKTGEKPRQNFVEAYELTYRINVPGNLVADPGIGAHPTTGTVQP